MRCVKQYVVGCGKIKYRNRNAAAEALQQIDHKRGNPLRREIRYYYCAKCHAYHLTSQAKKTKPLTTLSIDIETRSKNKLDKVGLFKYLQSSDFTILLFGYRLNKGPVKVVDLYKGEQIPREIFDMLEDPTVIKKAFNAAFEIECIRRHFLLTLPAEQWRCTMVKCAMLGLPMSLEDAGNALDIDTKKEMIGKSLVRFFTIPKKDSTYNRPEDFPEKWNEFKHYCGVDVIAEDQVDEKTGFFIIPQREQDLWTLDQEINGYGIEVNRVLIENAMTLDVKMRADLMAEAIKITGLANPNSVDQLKEWLELEIDDLIPNLKKESVHALIKDTDDKTVKRVLTIRQQLSKTSLKKYKTALGMIGGDNRAKGTLQYYGALRTGRWAGRLLQVHNFPKNVMKSLDLARNLLIAGEYDLIQALWNDVPYVLSQLLRTMFVAGKGKKFIMTDFSAIEARVIAWLAGEKWRLQLFERNGKLYEESASRIFHVPLENCGKGTKWRDMGKVYELALGFQGSVGAVRRMDTGNILKDMPDEDIVKDVRGWRDASPNIRQMWYDVQSAAISAVQTGKPTRVTLDPDSGLSGSGAIYKQILFFVKYGTLFCKLPSGRCLSYVSPVVKDGENGYPALWYLGIDQQTHQWKMIPTYGGKLVENIVQAIARDLLMEKMFKLKELGYVIPFHVHDEVILEVVEYREPHISLAVNHVSQLMGLPVDWAAGLPLAADAYASDYYYKKD